MGEFHSATMSIITVDGEPGEGPDLHRHPYEEVFVIIDGECTFTLGDETVVARAGDVLIAPPGTPHGFKISGDRALPLGEHPLQPGVQYRVAVTAARPSAPAVG